MSYTLYPYLIDLDRLRALYGGNNAILLQEIEQRESEAISFHNAQLQDYATQQGAPQIDEAMAEIVRGKIGHATQGWQYAYALEIFCRALGTPLPNEQFEGVSGAWLSAVIAIEGLAPLDRGSRLPLPLPPLDDFPAVTYLEASEASVILDHGTFDMDMDRPEWEEPLRAQYQGWLHEAVRSGHGLVFFLY